MIVLFFGSIQYFMSDKMVLYSSGAKLLNRSDDDELFQIVDELSYSADIDPPKLAIMDSNVLNAFATGRNPKNSLIAVTTGLRKNLNRSELRAVLAHEIAHIINGDVKVLAIANFFVMLSSFLMQMFFWNMLFGGMSRNRDSGGGAGAIFILYIITIIVYFIGQILVLALTRYREFGADYTGSNLSGEPMELASALRKISISSISIPSQDLRQFKTANAFMIIPVLTKDDVARLMSTHPPVEDRIRRLISLDKQQGT